MSGVGVGVLVGVLVGVRVGVCVGVRVGVGVLVGVGALIVYVVLHCIKFPGCPPTFPDVVASHQFAAMAYTPGALELVSHVYVSEPLACGPNV